MIRFLIVISLLFIYTSFKSTQLWPTQKWSAIGLTLLLFLLMVGGMFLGRTKASAFDETWFQVISWGSSLTIGLWATFIIISMPFDILHLGIFIWNRLAGSSELDAERRVVLFHTIPRYLAAFSAGLATLGFTEVLLGPKVKETKVSFSNLPPALKGLKITQISDLHVGPTLRQGYVEKVVTEVNSTNPDLIFFTGDMADANVDSIDEHLQPLAKLKAKYGLFYVTGNHEYYWGASELITKISSLGFTALINSNKIINIGDQKVMIAGVTDPAGDMLDGHTPDLKKAVATSEIAGFKILLAHRPDACLEAELEGINLQFSGHTHSGQFFPFSLFIGLAHKYSRGLYQHGLMQVYVNPGTGYWGPADRLGVMAEVSSIILA